MSWAEVISAPLFLQQIDNEPEWMARSLLAPHAVIGIASPRGLGKSHFIHHLVVQLAMGGAFRGEVLGQQHVMLIDRDNPPTETRRRLRQWGGANAPWLSILTRDKAPELTDQKAWAAFPYKNYGAFVLDAFGSATENADEKEAKHMAPALASLLDLVRKGPAGLVLFNTRRDGAAIRGSGVILDRIDGLFEVRDATGLRLDSRYQVWWDALPPADDAQWASNAKRRGKRTTYRLAFIPSKWRLGPQPDPWCVEIRLPEDGAWSCHDVTGELEVELTRMRGEANEANEQALAAAVEELKNIIAKRHAAGSPLRKYDQAESALVNGGIPRAIARDLLDKGLGVHWLQAGSGRKGDPIVLLPLTGSAATSPNGNGTTHATGEAAK